MSEQVADFPVLVIDFLPDFGEGQHALVPPGCGGVLADFQQPYDVTVVEQLVVLVACVQQLPECVEALNDLFELLVGHVVEVGLRLKCASKSRWAAKRKVVAQGGATGFQIVDLQCVAKIIFPGLSLPFASGGRSARSSFPLPWRSASRNGS